MRIKKYSRDEMTAAAVALLTAGFSTDSAHTVLSALPSECRIEAHSVGIGIIAKNEPRDGSTRGRFAYALPLNVGAILDLSKDTGLDSRRIARSKAG